MHSKVYLLLHYNQQATAKRIFKSKWLRTKEFLLWVQVNVRKKSDVMLNYYSYSTVTTITSKIQVNWSERKHNKCVRTNSFARDTRWYIWMCATPSNEGYVHTYTLSWTHTFFFWFTRLIPLIGIDFVCTKQFWMLKYLSNENAWWETDLKNLQWACLYTVC